MQVRQELTTALWAQAARVHIVNTPQAGSSIASSAHDDALTPSSTDCLECSEDIPMEIADGLGESCQESAVLGVHLFQWTGAEAPSSAPSDLELRNLIRADLETQAELYERRRTPSVATGPSQSLATSPATSPSSSANFLNALGCMNQETTTAVDATTDICISPAATAANNNNHAAWPAALPIARAAGGGHPGFARPAVPTAPSAAAAAAGPSQSPGGGHAPYDSYYVSYGMPVEEEPSAPSSSSQQPVHLHGCGFLGGWPEGSVSDRRLLVGWMVELVRAARLQRETLFCAASLLDRYLAAGAGSVKDYPPERFLQLLALACVSVAMKFEEVVPLHPSDLLRLAVDPATGRPLFEAIDLGQMERTLLEVLDWRTRAPNAHSFLQSFIHCLLQQQQHHHQHQQHLASPSVIRYAAGGGGRSAAPCWDSEAAAGAAATAGGSFAGGLDNDMSRSASSSSSTAGYKGGGLSAAAAAAAAAPAPAAAAAAPAGPRGLYGRFHAVWEGELTSWAYGLLDMALVHPESLMFRHSTLAMACMVLAERAAANTVVAAMAAAGSTFPPPGVSSAYGAAAASGAAAGGVSSGCSTDAYGGYYCTAAGDAYGYGYGYGFGGGGGLPACFAAVECATGLPLAVVAPDVAGCVTMLEQLWIAEQQQQQQRATAQQQHHAASVAAAAAAAAAAMSGGSCSQVQVAPSAAAAAAAAAAGAGGFVPRPAHVYYHVHC